MVRPYETADARPVAAIHNAVFPTDSFTMVGFSDYISRMLAFGGGAWVIESPIIAGYGLVVPVPGLPGVTELSGCIAPDRRRKRLGSRLLAGMIDALQETDTRQITYHVESLVSPVAKFLLHNDFFVEHEENLMLLDSQPRLIEERLERKTAIKTYPRKSAVPLFLRLYDQSFRDLPWDQPFTEQEIAELLDRADDLLFLTQGSETVGVAWVRADAEGTGVIEPLAVIPAYQNQGYGRQLLTLAIDVLAQRGIRQIEIGAWSDNERALHLYQSLGFRTHKTIKYLAYNLL